MRNRVSRRLAVLLLVGLAGSVRAEDQRLAGSKLVLRETKREQHLVLLARDGVLAPLPGGAEDPTLAGGVLDIANPRTGEQARFEMPARDWSVNGVGTVFRFRNHLAKGPGSEVRALVIRHQRRLKISTRALGITLDEEAQRALSVTLATGTRRYCLLFGGKIGKDRPGRFVARNAPAPTACPAPIAVVPTTTTTTSRPRGTGPTSTSVTSSTNVTSSTSITSTTAVPLPAGSTTTTPPGGGSTSTTRAPTTSSTTGTVRPTTSTSTSSSTTRPPPPTSTSSTSIATTSTTTTTARSCSLRGLSCRGSCPQGQTCGGFLLCTCR